MTRKPTVWKKIFANEASDKINLQNIQTVHTSILEKKKKVTQSKNRQKLYKDISPKKIWPKGT